MCSNKLKDFADIQRRLGLFGCLLWVGIFIALTQGGCGKDEAQNASEQTEPSSDGNENNPKAEEEKDVEESTQKTKKVKQGQDAKRGEVKSQDPTDPESDNLAAPDPASKRKSDRERRIDELRQRNEVRRQERLTRRSERDAANTNNDKPDQPNAAPPEIKDAPKQGSAKPSVAAPATPRAEPPAPQAPAMPLNRFLALADVRRVMGNKSLMEKGPLPGIEATEWYNSIYYSGTSNEQFGVGLQVWRETTRRNAHQRYKRMREEHNNAEDVEGVTAKTFFSNWGDIMVLTFADLTKRVVVSVSCGQSVGDTDKLFKLAKTVQEKL